jgi:hypothetical protein
MTNNPLTNVYMRMHKKRSSSRVIKAKTIRYKKTDLISQMYKNLGKNRSTSRDEAILEVEEQVIEDRFGDIPMAYSNSMWWYFEHARYLATRKILLKLLRIESHHHDNGNIINRTSMGIDLFNTNL